MSLCIICKSETKTFFDLGVKCTTHHCLECGVISKDIQHHPTQKQELHQYSMHNNSLENRGYVEMFEQFLEFTLANTKEVKTVLDFGSGPTPVLSYLLEKKGFKTTIYDKHFAPKPIVGKYDLITSTEVFEHLDSPLKTLKKLKSHLNANATISIMTQFHTDRLDFYKQWWYRKDPTHITFFTPHTFQVLAKMLDMKVVACDDQKQIVLST